MRSVVALLAAIVLLAPGEVGAREVTELDQFKKKVEKSAPDQSDLTPPVVCVCKGGEVNNNRAGQLVSDRALWFGVGGFTSVRVQCRVLLFDPASEQLASYSSCEVWELLPK